MLGERRGSAFWITVLLLVGSRAEGQTVSDANLEVKLVASGISVPTSMAFIGPGDILVLQKNNGMVRRVTNGVLQPGAVLDVAVHYSSERGLLGIATDPGFLQNHHVYLYYTESSTGADTNLSTSTPLGNRLYRYTWNGSALVDPVLVLDLPVTTGPNHNGGVIAFGPRDALFGVIGDLNRNGKLENFPAGPDPDDTGVIFRVTRAGQPFPDNPFFSPANPSDPMAAYFAYGVRNSFGLTFDPRTGDLWDTENGPASYDEVNRVIPGFNSGWEQIMGPDARDPQGQGDLWVAPGSTYLDPQFSWAATVAPTALAFAASPVLGCALVGDLLVGDNNCGQLYRFELDAAREQLAFASSVLQDRVADNGGLTCSGELGEILFGSGFGVVTDLENGPDGALNVVSATLGAIYRIGPRTGAFPDADADGVADACDCAPSQAGAYGLPVEVPTLRVTGAAATTLGWDSQAPTGGSATSYTVVTGDLSALRASGGFGVACTLAEGLGAPEAVDPRPAPAAGSAFYYLARASNACGNGSFGRGTGSPSPREVLDVSLPLRCTGLEGSVGGRLY